MTDSTKGKFGEPWHYVIQNGIASTKTMFQVFQTGKIASNCFDELTSEQKHRIIICVNALDGIADPQGLMDAVRDVVDMKHFRSGNHLTDVVTIRMAVWDKLRELLEDSDNG
jgi:hypothetical protein